MASIENQLNEVFQTILDFPAFGQWCFVTRQLQGCRQQGFVQFLKQSQSNRVIRNAQTNGLAFWMHHPARQFLGTFKDEGVAARCRGLEQTVLSVVDTGKVGNFGKVSHHEGQMMTFVHLTNLANAIKRILVAKAATQRIAGVRRQSNDTPLADKLGRLRQQARLRRFGMNINDAGHDSEDKMPDRLEIVWQLRQFAEIDVTFARPMEIRASRSMEIIVPGKSGEM